MEESDKLDCGAGLSTHWAVFGWKEYLMRSSVKLVPGSSESGRTRETANLLLMLKSHADSDWQIVLPGLPSWLTDAFAPELTDEEAEQWLARWRAAPDRLAFERESGWMASEWLHWFSSGNEFWRIGDVAFDNDCLTVYLEHDDYPIPFEALRWLAIVAGLRISSEDLIG
ncbi:hypothetical protein [Plantactinospora sp. DSM 117369]